MVYQVKKSNRKSYSVEIRNGQVLVRAPWFATKKTVEAFLRKHDSWIISHLNMQEEPVKPFTSREINELKKKAREYFTDRVEYYAGKAGVSFGKISIRAQRTRWGSCSANGNLSFNCVLMLMPEEIRDSVIVHELCHRKEMNHSKKFYDEVLKIYPEYRNWNRQLKTDGKKLIRRIP